MSLQLLLPLAAAGCAVPPAVTIASFAADGVSYVTTGKSVTDHGLSAATGHDCALLRPVLNEKPVCDTALSDEGKLVPVVAGGASAPRPQVAAVAPTVAPTVPAVVPMAAPGARYVIVGSFLDPDNAARAKARYAGLNATIVPAEVGGRRFHRVVVGPLSSEAAAALKLRLAAL